MSSSKKEQLKQIIHRNHLFLRAKANGVNFDVGHGQGSFSWKVAEAAARTKFWPDTISSDLHTGLNHWIKLIRIKKSYGLNLGNLQGAAKDLTYVMSKLLAVGMPLEKVTINPSNPRKLAPLSTFFADNWGCNVQAGQSIGQIGRVRQSHNWARGWLNHAQDCERGQPRSRGQLPRNKDADKANRACRSLASRKKIRNCQARLRSKSLNCQEGCSFYLSL